MDSINGIVHFKKLDGRNTGHGVFKYYAKTFNYSDYRRFMPSDISFNISRAMDYITLRKWAWDTWGPSCEFKEYINIWHAKEHSFTMTKLHNIRTGKSPGPSQIIKDFPLNPHWCFDNEKESRIYLRGDEEKMWFEMKWL